MLDKDKKLPDIHIDAKETAKLNDDIELNINITNLDDKINSRFDGIDKAITNLQNYFINKLTDKKPENSSKEKEIKTDDKYHVGQNDETKGAFSRMAESILGSYTSKMDKVIERLQGKLEDDSDVFDLNKSLVDKVDDLNKTLTDKQSPFLKGLLNLAGEAKQSPLMKILGSIAALLAGGVAISKFLNSETWDKIKENLIDPLIPAVGNMFKKHSENLLKSVLGMNPDESLTKGVSKRIEKVDRKWYQKVATSPTTHFALAALAGTTAYFTGSPQAALFAAGEFAVGFGLSKVQQETDKRQNNSFFGGAMRDLSFGLIDAQKATEWGEKNMLPFQRNLEKMFSDPKIMDEGLTNTLGVAYTLPKAPIEGAINAGKYVWKGGKMVWDTGAEVLPKIGNTLSESYLNASEINKRMEDARVKKSAGENSQTSVHNNTKNVNNTFTTFAVEVGVDDPSLQRLNGNTWSYQTTYALS